MVSSIVILSVVVRSVTAPVGRPPDQKKASIEPSFIACTDSSTPRPWRLMPLFGSMPAASKIRSAMISVPEFGAPTETRLPSRSSIDLMPEPALATTWV